MAKRLTKEQREANEIEELRKQLSAMYTTATGDDWLNDNGDALITPKQLRDVMWAVRNSFGLESDHIAMNHNNIDDYENPSSLATFLHSEGVRAWTKLPKEGGEA